MSIAAKPALCSPPATEAATAREAGLRYVNDHRPGIRRVRSGSGFRYLNPDGSRVTDPKALARIRKLAIPPGWTDVWICPTENGHIQAVGRDARRRKQYRYHERWRAAQDEAKYGRLLAFGKALPALRAAIDRDMALPGMPRRKVLATVVRLLETSLIRVGNDEYARHNGSFGLTTLRNRHVKVDGTTIRFRFRGKSGIRHEVEVSDPRLARVVRRCQELPGQELFEYIDEDGQVRDVGSADVNEYLRETAGEAFTAKDFRTWAGTVLAALALQEFKTFDTQTQARRNVMAAIRSVASRLGNTPSVCRKCYVHPHVIDAYLEGTMLDAVRKRADEAMDEMERLNPEEAAVLALLQRWLAQEAESDRRKAGSASGSKRTRRNVAVKPRT
jgi:DNA topoisomerase-1